MDGWIYSQIHNWKHKAIYSLSCSCLKLRDWHFSAGMGNESENSNTSADVNRCSAVCHQAAVAGDTDSATDTGSCLLVNYVQQDSSDLDQDAHLAGNIDTRLLRAAGYSNEPSSAVIPLRVLRSNDAHSSLPIAMERPLQGVSCCIARTSSAALPRRVCFSDELQYCEFNAEDGCLRSCIDNDCAVTQPQQDDANYHLTPSATLLALPPAAGIDAC